MSNDTPKHNTIRMVTEAETRARSCHGYKRDLAMTLPTAVEVARFFMALGHSPWVYKLVREGYAVSTTQDELSPVLMDPHGLIDHVADPTPAPYPQTLRIEVGADEADRILSTVAL